MVKYTTVKVSRELHDELTRRSGTLGMSMGEYVQRLLWLAMEKTTEDPVEEFKTLLAFAQRDKAKSGFRSEDEPDERRNNVEGKSGTAP